MDTIISNIGQLITPCECAMDAVGGRYSIQVTQDTQLCVRNGRISPEAPAQARAQHRTVDARGGVVMPGLIDPFWMMPCLPEWTSQLPASKLPARDLLSWSLRLLQRALKGGVTTIELKCSHDSAFEGLEALGHLRQHHQPRVVGTLLASFPEDGVARDRSVSSLIGEVIPEIRHRRLATFCDIGWSNHSGVITEVRAVLRAASGAGLRPKLHLDSAPLRDDVERLALSLEVAAIGCASHLPPEMARNLAQSHVIPVYLPGIRGKQTGDDIDVRPLLDQGLPIAIGSGNGLCGHPSMSMWAVLACSMRRMGLSLAEAIVACTLNNALAIEMSHEVGSLEHGKRADLIVLDLADYREMETTLGFPPISMVMVNGEIVHSA